MDLAEVSGGGWCVVAAVICALIAAAFGGAVVVLARRVASLAADLAELTGERPPCLDRGRIAALEDFARGGARRGRHGTRPPASGPPMAGLPDPAPDLGEPRVLAEMLRAPLPRHGRNPRP